MLLLMLSSNIGYMMYCQRRETLAMRADETDRLFNDEGDEDAPVMASDGDSSALYLGENVIVIYLENIFIL